MASSPQESFRLESPCRVVDDPATRRTVFVAPGRATRPHSADADACPFCAGHEHLAPDETLRAPADAALPWQARLIPNRYPLVVDALPADGASGAETGSGARAARGVHDVVIESPCHVLSILDVDESCWIASWRLVRDRLRALAHRGDLAWGTVFKNSGPAAGASVDHVHSQLVALDFVPAAVVPPPPDAEGRDFLAAAIDEAAREERLVAERPGLVAFVPRAPRQPFETWIVPRARERLFHEADDEAAAGLALFVRDVVARIARVAPGADYNWWLLQAPFSPTARGAADGWRWRLEILPRVSPLAGFELGTGCLICVDTPQASAARLRRGS